MPAAEPASPADAKQIASFLARRVIGQRPAIRRLAVALAKRLNGLHAGNILMIGSSGTGKTTLMRIVEDLFAQPGFADGTEAVLLRIHANVLAREAESGRPGQIILEGLLDRLRTRHGAGAPTAELLERVRHGIVFVDEIDKIRGDIRGTANVTGIRAQESLLTLMENEVVRFELPAWAGGGNTLIDSRPLLFIAAGAFEGLYDSVYDRVTIGRDRGALRPVTVMENGNVKQELPFRLRDWLELEDLFDYGMSPQFLSRFDTTVLLDDLGPEELVQILLQMPDAGYLSAREYFRRNGVDLMLSPAAAAMVANEARSRNRLGARALREVFQRVIEPYELEPGKFATDGAVLIDVAEVESALPRVGGSARGVRSGVGS